MQGPRGSPRAGAHPPDAGPLSLGPGAIAVPDQATLSAGVVLCVTNSAAKRISLNRELPANV